MSADTQRRREIPRTTAEAAGDVNAATSDVSTCDGIRGLIFRTCEGEASPDEAMRLARHLPDCTRCRILMARERRLAKMLELDLEDMPVGEDFVRTVMANLPGDPLPRPKNRRTRRGLKLAGFSGLVALIGLQGLELVRGLQAISERASVAWGSMVPGFDAVVHDTTLRGAFEFAGWVLIALRSMGAQLVPYVPSVPTLALAVSGVLMLAVCVALVGLIGVVVCTARALAAKPAS